MKEREKWKKPLNKNIIIKQKMNKTRFWIENEREKKWDSRESAMDGDHGTDGSSVGQQALH